MVLSSVPWTAPVKSSLHIWNSNEIRKEKIIVVGGLTEMHNVFKLGTLNSNSDDKLGIHLKKKSFFVQTNGDFFLIIIMTGKCSPDS